MASVPGQTAAPVATPYQYAVTPSNNGQTSYQQYSTYPAVDSQAYPASANQYSAASYSYTYDQNAANAATYPPAQQVQQPQPTSYQPYQYQAGPSTDPYGQSSSYQQPAASSGQTYDPSTYQQYPQSQYQAPQQPSYQYSGFQQTYQQSQGPAGFGPPPNSYQGPGYRPQNYGFDSGYVPYRPRGRGRGRGYFSRNTNQIPFDGDENEIVPNVVFISQLPKTITNEQLAEEFGSCGTISSLDDRGQKPKIWVYKDRLTREGKGEATVTYDHADSAQKAVNCFNGKEVFGKTITVELCTRKQLNLQMQVRMAMANASSRNAAMESNMGGGDFNQDNGFDNRSFRGHMMNGRGRGRGMRGGQGLMRGRARGRPAPY